MRFGMLLTAALVFGAAGCGDGLADVSGTVLVDGEPLKEGEIIFEAPDLSRTPAGGKIADGKYAIRVAPGPKRVKVLASRPTAKPDPVMGSAAREAAIAPEYNEKTTLTADVQPGRQTGVDFAVKALPKGK